MKEILPHWRFGPNSPVKDVDMERMTRGDRAVAEACRRAMESETWKELVILESLGVRFTELVGRFVSEVASPVLEAMPGDAFHQGAGRAVDAHGEDQGWWRDHPHHQDSRRER